MVNRSSCLLGLAATICLAAGCGSRVGNITIDVVRSWDPAEEPLESVASFIRLRVDGPDLRASQTYPYAQHSGALEIAAGEGRNLSIDGLGPEQNVVSRGRTGPISVGEGESLIPLYVGLVGKQGEFSYSPTRLAQARAFHAATLLGDGSVLLAGGTGAAYRPESGAAATAMVRASERVDGRSLRALGDRGCDGSAARSCLLQGRIGHTATLLASGNVLVAGGTGETSTPVAEVEIYDAVEHAFVRGLALGTPRVWHAAALGPRGAVVAGGLDSAARVLDTSEAYDKGTLEAMPSLKQSRRAFALTALPDGSLLASGGYDQQEQPLASTELLGPGSPSWSVGPSLRTARAWHTATLLEDGSVLLIGGLSVGGSATGSIERFDPRGNTIVTLDDSLRVARWAHTATGISDGRVIVVGGFGASKNGAAMASVEAIQLFDTGGVGSSASVRQLANLREARAGHSATRLTSDFVVVAGGTNASVALDTVEVFVY
jgi:hypothetical protein